MKRILIANRGEIAVRVIRACSTAGLTSIAVYADQDFDAMHVRLADEAYALEGNTAAQTYLNIDRIIEVARACGADAIHPGYGFLSENADFARAVEAAELIWIGPTADTIEKLGDKVTARALAEQVGAPLVPGTKEPLHSAAEAAQFAREHGVPVAIKAAFGGGGRGLKVARTLDEVESCFDSATREATAAFGRGECFIERFLENPRHVEVQILGDGEGNVVVVGDRDCSLQRRNQKLVEEAPAPGLAEETRSRMHEAARRICASVNYRSAGTVEFLLGQDGTLSFLEVNTRLQVEHPVTEAVTDVDLVLEQFRIAQGLGMSFDSTPPVKGHAIEMRINAEDPGRGFLPSPGVVESLQVPAGPGVRWDAGVGAGDRVETAFDSMIAKLIVWGSNREQALNRARTACKELEVSGVATVLPFIHILLNRSEFTELPLAVSTQWIERKLMGSIPASARSRYQPADELTKLPIEVGGKRLDLRVPANMFTLAVGMGMGAGFAGVQAAGPVNTVPTAPVVSPGAILAPVSGSVVKLLVESGARVSAGQEIAVCEAMKMETKVSAPASGIVAWKVGVGDTIMLDTEIGIIQPA